MQQIASRRLCDGSKRAIHTTLDRWRGAIRHPGWYLRDYKPGPYPETEEERKASAIRYGLRPEDYKPIDKDDVIRYAGDYPELGDVRYAHKDPYENFTDRVNRRNWGEPARKEWIKFKADRAGGHNPLNDEDLTFLGFLWYGSTVLIPLALAFYYLYHSNPSNLRWKNPLMPKQFPLDYYRAWPLGDPQKFPIVNYTFEPLEEQDSASHS